MMGHMPAIPESTRDSITWRLLQHAGTHWPQLSTVQVRCRGSFAYITGVLPSGEQIPLFRLRYGGSAHSFGFAIYSAARGSYDDAVLPTGLHAGTPQEALSGVRRLIDQDQVFALLAGSNAGATLPVMPLINRAKIPFAEIREVMEMTPDSV